MNEDISRMLILVCAELDLEPRSYSGRAMYGADCVGVDCHDPFQAFARIVGHIAEDPTPDGRDLIEHLTRDGAVRTDSMGRGSILYFPRLPWVGREDEDEEDEDPCSEPAISA